MIFSARDISCNFLENFLKIGNWTFKGEDWNFKRPCRGGGIASSKSLVHIVMDAVMTDRPKIETWQPATLPKCPGWIWLCILVVNFVDWTQVIWKLSAATCNDWIDDKFSVSKRSERFGNWHSLFIDSIVMFSARWQSIRQVGPLWILISLANVACGQKGGLNNDINTLIWTCVLASTVDLSTPLDFCLFSAMLAWVTWSDLYY